MALAALAASPIARASHMSIGFEATRIAIAGYIMPFMAVYTPALMLQDGGELAAAIGYVPAVVYIVVKAVIAIGLWGLRQALQHRVHAHEHSHGGEAHVHIHVHGPKTAHESSLAHRHTHAAFGIGILHGLAGSSHLLGVLPMLAFPTKAQALGYLAAFAVGTVISMAGFTWAMGLAARHCAARGLQIYRGLMITCCVAAMVVGCVWIVQTFSTAAGHAAG